MYGIFKCNGIIHILFENYLNLDTFNPNLPSQTHEWDQDMHTIFIPDTTFELRIVHSIHNNVRVTISREEPTSLWEICTFIQYFKAHLLQREKDTSTGTELYYRNVCPCKDGLLPIESPDEECIICRTNAVNKQWCCLKCLHKYHYHCIHEWVYRSNTCPLCRGLIHYYKKCNQCNTDGYIISRIPINAEDIPVEEYTNGILGLPVGEDNTLFRRLLYCSKTRVLQAE